MLRPESKSPIADATLGTDGFNKWKGKETEKQLKCKMNSKGKELSNK